MDYGDDEIDIYWERGYLIYLANKIISNQINYPIATWWKREDKAQSVIYNEFIYRGAIFEYIPLIVFPS